MGRVAVLGGGVAGLTAAYALTEAGVSVTLYEAGHHIGGQVRTKRVDGFVIDEGAEGFVTGDEAMLDLCHGLHLQDELLEQRNRTSYALKDGTLTPLEAGQAASILGIQVTRSDLGRGLTTLRAGMGRLTEALASALDERGCFRRGARVTRVSPTAGEVTVQFADGSTIAFKGVVLAVPPQVLGPLVRGWAPEAAAAAGGIPCESNVSVSLGYPRDAVTNRLDGSGFVIGPGGKSDVRACAYSSSKFDGRAPDGSVLLRGFFRPSPDSVYRPDGTWVARAVEALAPVLGLEGSPAMASVARWPDALPQYPADHHDRVREVADTLANQGLVVVAGAAYERSGLPGAVRSGRRAASTVLEGL